MSEEQQKVSMKHVRINHDHYTLIIVPCTSGITITHQSGGLACHQNSVEGILLPVPIDDNPEGLNGLNAILEDIHPGCYGQSITRSEADMLDAAFLEQKIPLVVNQDRLAESEEAWLHVRFRNKDERWWPPIPEEEIQNVCKVAEVYNPRYDPATTPNNIREIWDAHRTGDTSIWADFSGQEAILIWENCD